MEMQKAYSSKDTEKRIYELWEKSGFFTPENLPGKRSKTFVSTIAPPNITGELHMGHALEHSLQDIIIRIRRMQGYKTLWLPGIDHAGIAAQNVVEKQLKKEGISRHDLGREKFEHKVQEWKEKYGTIILGQFKKLGISVDWSRTRYTRDTKYEKSVLEAFNRYRDEGWIYKGERVINWCARCSTAISDLEVKYFPEKTKLYYIKYGPLTLATTRPETKLGDTALAVHPNDERYKKYIGKKLSIDSVDTSIPREQSPSTKRIDILVVSDDLVDPNFGTGVIKVTPAHDTADAQIAIRHNLKTIKIIDEHGRMNENAGTRFHTMKVIQARELIVKDLESIGLLEKAEDYEHNSARCDRCNSIIEPLPSEQWFLKVAKLGELARQALIQKEVVFHPSRWNDIVLKWLENMKDWNISRQLWWGHKIPIVGEEDVLDTWFSSALWPFATLGWPEKTSDYKAYYPTDLITSDRGIIFLWHLRMIFSGKFFTGKVPFKNIYIHATVLTKDGKRMSKSLGTGVDPLVLIDKYGADALRFGLAYQTTELQDIKFGENHIIMGKKFANKIWNISRYVLMRIDKKQFTRKELLISSVKVDDPLNKELILKFSVIAKKVDKHISAYQFGDASHELYDFIWHDFADKYLELSKNKDDQETLKTLITILVASLKLLHPFMPFVTEEIYSKIPITDKGLLVVETWHDVSS